MVEKSSRIAVSYDIAGALREAGVLSSHPPKRLRRLPHLFCRLLELPVDADSPVQVQESPSSFTFQVTLPPPLPHSDNIRAQVIHIVPGITKVCVAGARISTAHLDELDIPLWRFRLPASSLPEASTASCDGDGLLVLKIPKAQSVQEAPPSLLDAYQVHPKSNLSTPSPDVSQGAVMHVEGCSSQSEVCNAAEGGCAVVQDANSSSISTNHGEIGS